MKKEPRITIQLRVKADDKEFIEQKARALGLSVSAFVRIATLTYKNGRGPLPASTGAPDDRQTLRSEVSRYDKRTTDK
jgi:antitoxin component of RelBE/YafQ-DinJ toxin-antitoxin module